MPLENMFGNVNYIRYELLLLFCGLFIYVIGNIAKTEDR